MTDDAIRGMRRAYYADVAVIDDAVGRIVAALDARGLLDDTWIVYTSDHGEMGGDHGLMSKCVLYEPTVRVPLIIRPPGGCAPAVVDALVEHVDVPATMREIAGAPPLVASEGRSLLGYLTGAATRSARRHDQRELGLRLVRDRPLQARRRRGRPRTGRLFRSRRGSVGRREPRRGRRTRSVVDDLMDRIVRPFFRTPALRPHRSPFAG